MLVTVFMSASMSVKRKLSVAEGQWLDSCTLFDMLVNDVSVVTEPQGIAKPVRYHPCCCEHMCFSVISYLMPSKCVTNACTRLVWRPDIPYPLSYAPGCAAVLDQAQPSML